MLWLLVEIFRHQHYFQAWANSNHDDALHCYNFVTIFTKTHCLMLTCHAWRTLIHSLKLVLVLVALREWYSNGPQSHNWQIFTNTKRVWQWKLDLHNTWLQCSDTTVADLPRGLWWGFVKHLFWRFDSNVTQTCTSVWTGTCPLFRYMSLLLCFDWLCSAI